MKRLLVVIIILSLCIMPMAALAAETDEDGFEYGLVKENGLIVKSLNGLTASFGVEIPPCDCVIQEDNWYCYQYSDYGLKWLRNGGKDPQVWNWAQNYADGLCMTGYYEPIKSDVKSDEAFYLLRYIGSGDLTETFCIRNSDPDDAAIVIASYLGDVKIYYSRDIVTSDLEETADRLGIYIGSTGRNSADDPWEHDCVACGFDGSCNVCGGSGQVYSLVPGTNDYVWQNCTDVNCRNGRCGVCGGDGMT